MGIILCVPNVSEGRDAEKINALRDVIELSGANLLNTHTDAEHNRTVFTFTGTPDVVGKAVLGLVKKASELIDLREHTGLHPRIGAVDVVPLIPFKDIDFDDIVPLLHRIAEGIGKMGIPVYLYGRTNGRGIEDIRRLSVQYDELKELIKHPEHKPDYGPAELGPAGAVLLGLRDFILAYNIYLTTSDIKIGRRIASRVRENGGGLPGVKALAFYIPSQDRVQVSMNITRLDAVSMWTVYSMVDKLAHSMDTGISHSEIVGMIPEDYVIKSFSEVFKLKDFTYRDILRTGD